MASSGAAVNWRDEFKRSFEHLVLAIDSELAQTRHSAVSEGERNAAEGLNQFIRRMRGAATESNLFSLLVEASALFASRSAAIVLDGNRARVVDVRGFIAVEIQFDVNSAAAVLSAVETKDPVAAAATAVELSRELWAAASRDLETVERSFLFPLVSAGAVRAILFALGDVRAAPLELLTEAAAMRLELLDFEDRARPKPSGAGDPGPARAWNDLPPQDQAIHLRAQRFARVKVAEMRLARPAAVREGQERGAIYKILRPEIDTAREAFRKEFVAATPTMVDYLYIELVRSLANDDDRLLGPDFPGRLI